MKACAILIIIGLTLLGSIYLMINPEVKLIGQMKTLEQRQDTLGAGVNKVTKQMVSNDQVLQQEIQKGDNVVWARVEEIRSEILTILDEGCIGPVTNVLPIIEGVVTDGN